MLNFLEIAGIVFLMASNTINLRRSFSLLISCELSSKWYSYRVHRTKWEFIKHPEITLRDEQSFRRPLIDTFLVSYAGTAWYTRLMIVHHKSTMLSFIRRMFNCGCIIANGGCLSDLPTTIYTFLSGRLIFTFYIEKQMQKIKWTCVYVRNISHVINKSINEEYIGKDSLRPMICQ